MASAKAQLASLWATYQAAFEGLGQEIDAGFNSTDQALNRQQVTLENAVAALGGQVQSEIKRSTSATQRLMEAQALSRESREQQLYVVKGKLQADEDAEIPEGLKYAYAAPEASEIFYLVEAQVNESIQWWLDPENRVTAEKDLIVALTDDDEESSHADKLSAGREKYVALFFGVDQNPVSHSNVSYELMKDPMEIFARKLAWESEITIGESQTSLMEYLRNQVENPHTKDGVLDISGGEPELLKLLEIERRKSQLIDFLHFQIDENINRVLAGAAASANQAKIAVVNMNSAN
ncbi:hypothetical protein [Marinobacterium jannaschii]|uniref:hypothetical protein n=1 Tax=Marinobacterium jannaschii TaxID=64970 RepID=UPI0012EC2EAC|nr:hypothetical protein [Marinobacterium jannaschii]